MKDLNIAIAGTGHTSFGRHGSSLEELIGEAAREALQDAQVSGEEIDAVFLGHFNAGLVPDCFASSLVFAADDGLRFSPATRVENACASGMAAVAAAVHMLASGRARTVLVVGAEKMTHRSTTDVTASLACAGYQGTAAEAKTSFPEVFASLARSYGQAYGDPLPNMARIAAKNHSNAMTNPLAQLHKTLDFEACNNVSDRNPLIAAPLRLSDCSPISDGAAAVVLRSEHRTQDGAVLRDLTQVNDRLPLAQRNFLDFEGPTRAIAALFDRTGTSLSDLDFAEVHDCFTIAELRIYEAMGLAAPGRGGDVLADGTVYRDGTLPVNASGGLKAKGHPVGATGVSMLVLAARQVTGRADGIQIKGAERGMVFNMGGAGVANYAALIEAA